jgi:hypothetical protein
MVEIEIKVIPARPRFAAKIEITDSAWVHFIEYDQDHEILDATLRDGKRYRYRKVTPDLVTRVVFARSSGAAMNQFIRPLKAKKLPARRKYS